MKEFVMIFRQDQMPEVKYSPEEMQAIFKKWQDWLGGIAAQGAIANPGNRLGTEGRTLRPGNIVTDGPYAEIKEMISGYILVKANTLDDAFKMAYGCPGLAVGGSVEVRAVAPSTM